MWGEETGRFADLSMSRVQHYARAAARSLSAKLACASDLARTFVRASSLMLASALSDDDVQHVFSKGGLLLLRQVVLVDKNCGFSSYFSTTTNYMWRQHTPFMCLLCVCRVPRPGLDTVLSRSHLRNTHSHVYARPRQADPARGVVGLHGAARRGVRR